MLGKLGQLLGGNVLKGANKLVETVWGSEENESLRRAKRRSEAVDQFSKEFRKLENRTWWDALVDGLNRLPRPVLVVMVLGYFGLAYGDPTEFQVLNTALDGVPDEAWFLLGAIVTFYFGARELDKNRGKSLTLTKAQFADQQARIHELREGAGQTAKGDASAEQGGAPSPKPEASRNRDTGAAGHVSDARYQAEMASDRPLSDKVIREWNERHRGDAGNRSGAAGDDGAAGPPRRGR